MNPLNEWYFRQEEPARNLLLFLREKILNSDENISETLSFGLPFFKYKKKMLCYFHFHKKFKKYYLSFYKANQINYPQLIKEDRKAFQILLIDEDEDLPIELIFNILEDLKPIVKP